MSSGYFPLDRDSEDGKALLAAADAVERVRRKYACGIDDLTTEDAAADGGSFALLDLAVKLIRDEVRDA